VRVRVDKAGNGEHSPSVDHTVAAVGAVAGIFLHRFVMAQIKVDLVDFSAKILRESFLYSIALTFLFNFIVSLFMEIKLVRINMAESLKSVE
jgi:putative ABC transport system permease protein